METIFIVHLGKVKRVVHKADKAEDAVNYVKSRNKNSIYLKNETVDAFLVNDAHDDGLYIIRDKNDEFIKVYKLETLILPGYVYNAEYKIRKLLSEYELIAGDYSRL